MPKKVQGDDGLSVCVAPSEMNTDTLWRENEELRRENEVLRRDVEKLKGRLGWIF